jgi:hypothetical protein
MTDSLDMVGTETTPHASHLMDMAQTDRAAHDQHGLDAVAADPPGTGASGFVDCPTTDTPDPLGFIDVDMSGDPEANRPGYQTMGQ